MIFRHFDDTVSYSDSWNFFQHRCFGIRYIGLIWTSRRSVQNNLDRSIGISRSIKRNSLVNQIDLIKKCTMVWHLLFVTNDGGSVLLITRLLRLVGRWTFVNRFNHTIRVTAVTPTDRPKSVRNRCLIKVFGGVFYVVTLLFGFSCGCRGFCHMTESDLFLFLSILH